MKKKTETPLAIVFLIVGIVLAAVPSVYNKLLLTAPKTSPLPKFALVSWMCLVTGIILVILAICGFVADSMEKKRQAASAAQ